MTVIHLAEALQISFSLVGLWILTFVLFPEYRVDAFRHRLFKLRAELFDYASSGAISFDHPAYGLLRLRMNDSIRFAHRFTSLQLLFVLTFNKHTPHAVEPLRRWQQAVSMVESEDARKRLIEFSDEMTQLLVWHLVTGSVVLLVALVAFGICFVIRGTPRAAFASFATRLPGVARLELQAAEVGSAIDAANHMAVVR
jgi:hypothetical protein